MTNAPDLSAEAERLAADVDGETFEILWGGDPIQTIDGTQLARVLRALAAERRAPPAEATGCGAAPSDEEGR